VSAEVVVEIRQVRADGGEGLAGRTGAHGASSENKPRAA
jgi:hypothetical protein